jgi:hypothetical protein
MWYNIRAVGKNPLTNTFSKKGRKKIMKYTVTINEKSKTVVVNLNGYEGVAKCCETDTFNLQTGIELALERARVAEANAKKSKPTTKQMSVMELVKALETALPKGQVVIVGNGNGLTAEQKKWLHSMTDCKGGCKCGGYTEEDLDEAYNNGYADGAEEADCDCDNCEYEHTEADIEAAYDEGYADGHRDGYDEGCEEGLDEDDVIEAVRNALRQ